MKNVLIFAAAAVAGYCLVKHCGKQSPSDAQDYQANNIESACPPPAPIQREHPTPGPTAGEPRLDHPVAAQAADDDGPPAAFVDGAGV